MWITLSHFLALTESIIISAGFLCLFFVFPKQDVPTCPRTSRVSTYTDMVNFLSTCTLTQCVSCLHSTSSNNAQPMSPHTLTKCIPFLNTHWHNVSPVSTHIDVVMTVAPVCIHTDIMYCLSPHTSTFVYLPLTLYSVFVFSRLDYCISLSAGCPNILTSNNRSRTMLPDSFSKPPDPSTWPSDSYASFSSLATYWVKDRIQTAFALRLSFIKPPSIFQTLFTFTLLPGSCLLQIPECSEYQVPNKVQQSVLFLLPGSSYLEPTPCFCPSCYLCQSF